MPICSNFCLVACHLEDIRPSRLVVLFRWASQVSCLLATVTLCSNAADAPGVLPSKNLIDQSAMNRALADRSRLQKETAAQVDAFHNFSFTESLATSGITFRHQIVDDAGKHFRGNHYDHGSAVVAADIDGDGLPDLFFASQLGSNGLFRNLGGGKFEDITARAGVGMEDQISVGASFADLDNDGLPDLVVTTVRHGNRLFHNLGGGRFQDVTQAAGFAYSGHSSGIVCLDFDRDGLLDVLVCNVGRYTTDEKGAGGYYVGFPNGFRGHLFPDRTEYSILYKNLGGMRFKDVTEEAGLRVPSWTGDATFADLNGDGFPDLYLLNMQGDNHYFENQSGHQFIDRTAATFPKTSWGGMGIKFFDFAQDGHPSLYVTDMHSDMTGLQTKISKINFTQAFEKNKSESWCTTEYNDDYLQGAANNVFGNSFYRGTEGGKFTEVSDQVGAETFWPWGISVGDLNADGYEDVFIPAGMGFGFRYGINSLLLNVNGTRFADAEFILGVEPRALARRYHTAFVLDCDGLDRDHPLARGRSGKLPISAPASSRSSVILDIDGDGDLDIVSNEMGDAPLVLISDLASRKSVNFLTVRLIGKSSNRDGLGARVQVTTGGRTWTQFHDGKSGHLGQSSVPLYFGLGVSTEVEKVEIHWPSGKRQTIKSPISIRKLLVATEPE